MSNHVIAETIRKAIEAKDNQIIAQPYSHYEYNINSRPDGSAVMSMYIAIGPNPETVQNRVYLGYVEVYYIDLFGKRSTDGNGSEVKFRIESEFTEVNSDFLAFYTIIRAISDEFHNFN